MSTKPISSMDTIPTPTGMDVKEFVERRRKAKLGTKALSAATEASGPAAQTSSPNDEVIIPATVKFEGLSLKQKETQARLMTFEERDGYLKARCEEAQAEIDAGLGAALSHFAVATQIIRENGPFFDVHFEEMDGQGVRTDLGSTRQTKSQWLKNNLPGIHKSTFYKALNAAKREYAKLMLPETEQGDDGEVEPHPHKDSEAKDQQDAPAAPVTPTVSSKPSDQRMTVGGWMEWRKLPYDAGTTYERNWIVEAASYTEMRHDYSLEGSNTRKLIRSLSDPKAVRRNAKDFAKYARSLEWMAQDFINLAQAIKNAIADAQTAAAPVAGDQSKATETNVPVERTV